MSTSTLSNPVYTLNISASLVSGTFPTINAALSHRPTITPQAGNTGPGYCDVSIEQPITITSGTPITINVHSGTDSLGNAVVMAHVWSITIENDSTTSGQDFTVGGGTHPLMGSDQWTVKAGNSTSGPSITSQVQANEWTVTSGSADTITISVAAGTAVSGKITILGRTT